MATKELTSKRLIVKCYFIKFDCKILFRQIYQLDVDYTDCYEKKFLPNMSPDDLKPGGHSGNHCSKVIEDDPEKTCFCDTVQ